MSFQQYDKLVGETFFEATLLAENKYGKGNFEIITSKKVKKSIYLGLGHKELVEVTICIVNRNPAVKAMPDIPTRPLPSVEIRSSKPVFSGPGIDRANFDRNSTATNVATPIISRPISQPAAGIRAYNQQKIAPTEMRKVDTLRSIQEGNDDPHPQKAIEEGLHPDQIQDILAEIIAVKDQRQRRDRIANMPTDRKAAAAPRSESSIAASAASAAPHLPLANLSPELKKFEIMEERMNDIMAMLQNLNRESGKALEKKIPEMPDGLYQIKKNLLAIETPMDIADQVIFDLKEILPSSALRYPIEALRATTNWLERQLRFSPELDFKRAAGPKIVVLIGPTGVGKTTTIAKLAASYGLNMKDRKSIALFTLDTFRIGASEQLQHYAQIIDVDMEVLYRPEDIDSALPRHQDKDLIIVDTAGRCPKDTEELCELGTFIERLPSASKYLVLSATSKYTDMLDAISCFGRVGFDHLIFTKVDETNTIGPLLAILFKTGKSLAYITNGQKVPEDFRKADFDFFNSRLFPDAEI